MSKTERDRLAERIATLRAAVAWMDKMAPDHMNDAMEIIDAQAAEIERLRESVIEECAKVCDARFTGDLNREDQEARRCAAAIRALKEREAGA